MLKQLPQYLLRALFGLLLIFSLMSLANWGSRYWFWFELIGHFKLQWLFALACVVVVLASVRQFRWALVGILILAFNLAELSPWYIPRAEFPPKARRTLRIYFQNIALYNNQEQALIQQLREHTADLVVLQEVNRQYIKALNALPEYPYRYLNLKSKASPGSSQDMALWSRYPLRRPQRDVLKVENTPSMQMQVQLPSAQIELLVLHPESAHYRGAFPLRQRQMQALSDYLQARPAHWIVLGDLNITPWSGMYRRMVERTGLLNTRLGFGFLRSYPTGHRRFEPQSPSPHSLLNPSFWERIPIDHCLVSPEIQVESMRILPDPMYSDHFPILMELAYPVRSKLSEREPVSE